MRKLLLTLLLSCQSPLAHSQPELIYHVFQRSFFDSNGDGHGDLPGIRQKLDYLQELGVTTILLTPLYVSGFYHNYFADDFERIDPAYGSLTQYADLVKEVHRRKMKILQDVEMQYVTGKHKWFSGSYKNPVSAYGQYLLYNDTSNQQPAWFFGVPEFVTYNGSREQIIMVNLKHPDIKAYTRHLLECWMDPDSDGVFDDGVDGFRLDHAMDDLDNAGKLTNLFADFWAPMLDSLRAKNPAIRIVAEQANWGSYGFEYLERAKVDRVFAFRLKQAMETFDKQLIMTAADSCFRAQQAQVVFIENHDTRRFASVASQDPGKMRAAATLNLLLGGIPSIYYGQELGMTGSQLKGKTDGNDIPIREAFEWYKSGQGRGMAYWYANTGPWWDSSQIKPCDGISVEEEERDSSSLLNHYRKLARLRKINPALYDGMYRPAINNNPSVISFIRTCETQSVLVAVNLSATPQEISVELNNKAIAKKIHASDTKNTNVSDPRWILAPYDYIIMEIAR